CGVGQECPGVTDRTRPHALPAQTSAAPARVYPHSADRPVRSHSDWRQARQRPVRPLVPRPPRPRHQPDHSQNDLPLVHVSIASTLTFPAGAHDTRATAACPGASAARRLVRVTLDNVLVTVNYFGCSARSGQSAALSHMAFRAPAGLPVIQTLCIWLVNTALSHLFAELGWFVPTVQTVHILGIAVVITLLFVLNFRLLRITRSGPPLQRIAQDSLPWVWRALLVLLTTGVLLTITEPARELLNSAFRWKMLMVVVLAVLTAVIQFAL